MLNQQAVHVVANAVTGADVVANIAPTQGFSCTNANVFSSFSHFLAASSDANTASFCTTPGQLQTVQELPDQGYAVAEIRRVIQRGDGIERRA